MLSTKQFHIKYLVTRIEKNPVLFSFAMVDLIDILGKDKVHNGLFCCGVTLQKNDYDWTHI